jgi:hypothetical protein
MVTLTMILAWLFALVAQWKMGEFKAKNATRARVPFWSLMRATWGVVLIGYLLIDLLTTRAALNLFYILMMDDYGRTLYAPLYSNASIGVIVSQMLYEGFTYPVLLLGLDFVYGCFWVTVLTGPILWFFNLFERS